MMYRSKVSVIYVKRYSDLKISDKTFAGYCIMKVKVIEIITFGWFNDYYLFLMVDYNLIVG